MSAATNDPAGAKCSDIGCRGGCFGLGAVAVMAAAAVAACAGLIAHRDVYVERREAYRDLVATSPHGEARVSLVGRWVSGDVEAAFGGPYRLVVEFETPDRDAVSADLEAFALRNARTGRSELFQPGEAAGFRAVGGEYGGPRDPRTGEPLDDPRPRRATLEFADVPLAYEEYEVSGSVRVVTRGGSYDVPIRGLLRRDLRVERHSRIWSTWMSV